MSHQSIVGQWNEVLLDAIRSGVAKPTASTYQLHLTSAAVYDAWAAYDADAYGYYSEIEASGAPTEAGKAEAVSYAAYRMLVALFPEQTDKFDAFMASLGLDSGVTTTDPSSAAGVGNLAAANGMAARADDGSNFANGFADTSGYTPVNDPQPGSSGAPGGADFDPNHWQPLRVPNGTLTTREGLPIYDNDDPSTYTDQTALTPQWGGVDPFALASGGQFRPPPPPRLGDPSPYVDGLGHLTTGDQAYRDQVAQVLETSASLTNREKAIAELSADGPRTESPPGHWNQIAQDIALREGHGIDEDAKLFFAVNAVVFDAGIATWEAKYVYDYVRPQSAIRNLYYDQEVEAWGGPNQGTQTILGQQWRPYQNVTFVTPPFPEYVSGHSTFSMSAARTIAAFVGSDRFYDGATLGNYDLDTVPGTDLLGQYVTDRLAFEAFDGDEPVVLQWETLTEAAEEAGISRLYGGIHIQDGNLRGLELGEKIAANAQVRWEALFTRGGDDDLHADRAGGLLLAGAGDDTVRGDRGDDIVEGGSGDDVIRGHRGDDLLLGEAGEDHLSGGRGDDDLSGGDGQDELRGGRGDDDLSGGDGYDELRGGSGDDTFFFVEGETGFDIVEDFDAEDDMLVLSGYAPAAVVSLVEFGRDLILAVDGDEVALLRRTDAEEVEIGVNLVFEDTLPA